MRLLWLVGLVLGVAACDPVTSSSPSCAEYCDRITSTCTGEFEQYPSADVCVRYCEDRAELPAGTVGDETGNSVSCRFKHTEYAEENPPQSLASHCDHAGPTGDGLCGSFCENYCHLALRNCPELFDGERPFCDSECAASIASISTAGGPSDTVGDTIQCRITHLGLAGGEEATRPGHCAAAALQDSTDCSDGS